MLLSVSYNIRANPKGGGSCDPPWRAYHHFSAVIKAASAITALIITSATSRAVGFLFSLTTTFFILPPPFLCLSVYLLSVCIIAYCKQYVKQRFDKFGQFRIKDAHNARFLYAIMLSWEKYLNLTTSVVGFLFLGGVYA